MIEGQWSLQGESITGLAKPEAGREPVWVELLADGDVMGITRADLADGPDNCGFYLQVPAALLEEGVDLAVRVANTDQYLPEIREDKPEEEAGAEALKKGLAAEIMLDKGLYVSGWAIDHDKSDEKLVINAFCDGRKIATTLAAEKRYRPPHADGHGFSLQIPYELADGEKRLLVFKDSKNRELPGSPLQIRLLPDYTAQWLRLNKKPDRTLFDLMANIFEQNERRLPGIASFASYEAWKKAFPPPAPKKRQKASLGFWRKGIRLPKQEGVDLSLNQDKPEFYLFVNEGDRLAPQALAHFIENLRFCAASMIYADSENEKGEPLFKSAWDREAFLAKDQLGPFLIRADAFAKAGVSPDDDYASARAKAALAAEELGAIAHLPLVLSRSATLPASSARDKFLQGWLDANYPGSRLRASGPFYNLAKTPRVSIIIPTRDHGDLLAQCLQALEKTDWPDYEIIIIDNGTREADALAILRDAATKPNIRVIAMPGVFNYAHLNNEAAKEATGELLCFLNNDTEALHPEWLSELARLLLKDGEAAAGCVGAKLLWPNRLVQHGGVVIGIHQLAGHIGNQWLEDEPGYMGMNLYARQFSAVTAACLLTPLKLFIDLGGFDGRRFPVAFNDVDYCLRVRESGRKVFWTPNARLMHHESASRGKDSAPSARARASREVNFFRQRWGAYDDPFYNPNLPLSAIGEPCQGLAFPPRPRAPRPQK